MAEVDLISPRPQEIRKYTDVIHEEFCVDTFYVINTIQWDFRDCFTD
jgi:hypothetical protein